MQLYALAEEYQSLLELAESTVEEDAQAFADTLEGLRGEINDKVESCAAVIRSIASEAEAINKEIDRLDKRKKSLLSNVDRIKKYMLSSMEQCAIEKVKGKLFTIAIRKNPPSVVIDDEAMIPLNFTRTKIEVDKSALSTALKAGTVVAGAHLEQSKRLAID